MNRNIHDIEETILKVYKSLESPDFSFVQRAVALEPYKEMIAVLKENYNFVDSTDVNDDVCFHIELESNSSKWVLQLSMVGKFAALYRLLSEGDVDKVIDCVEEDSTSDEIDLIKLLLNCGFWIMKTAEMEEPVGLSLINTEPECVTIYQALFSDTECYPWMATDH